GMIQNAREFAEAGIPFIFDPGQAMPLFNGEELRAFIEQADYVTVNDYESNLLQERTGWDEKTIAGKVKAYIATRGPKGACIHADGKVYNIPPAHERRVTDPTGCGDAFRAGLIFGIEKGYDWETIGRTGNLMGALKVEHPGTQNQRFDYAEFAAQFRQQFGYALSGDAPASVPVRQPRPLQPAHFELDGTRAAGLDRVFDREPLRAVDHPPQRLLVIDEHGDGLVGVGAVGGHAYRRGIVHGHRHPAGAVAVEVA